MSRTYRLRHLPRLRAKKFIDADTGRFHTQQEALVDELFRCVHPDAFDEEGEVRLAYWGVRWAFRDKIVNEFVVPVAGKWSHPWVSWGTICTAKAWYKKNGNRRVRKRNRWVLKMFAHLGDAVDNRYKFYEKDDGWDLWSLW